MSVVAFPVVEIFNLPRGALFLYGPREKVVHIGRTLVAGCQTECGVTIHGGWFWASGPTPLPGRLLCKECRYLIDNLPALRERCERCS